MKTLTLLFTSALLAAIGWLAGGSTAWAETITGTFRYGKKLSDVDIIFELRPIRFCKVEVHSFRPRPPFGVWTWGLELETTTDAKGSISVTMPFQGSGVTYDLKVFAQNYAAVVLPAGELLATGPFWQEPGFPDGAAIWRRVTGPSDVLDFSYNFRDAYTPQHWNLAEVVRHGFDYVSARRDPSETDPLPPMPVHAGFHDNTVYNASNRTLEIQSVAGVTFSDSWQDFVILHEYAHFVMHQIGTFAGRPALPFFGDYYHDGCKSDLLSFVESTIVNSPENAWMEGFGRFFAKAVAADHPPRTFLGSSRRDIEDTPWTTCTDLPATITPNMIENVVAGVLWDLVDAKGNCSSSEAHDALSGFDTNIIQILDRELDNMQRGPTLADFTAAWIARGLPAEPLRDILRHHGILPPLPAPKLTCPGDIIVTASEWPSCGRTGAWFPAPTLAPNLRCAVVICDPYSGFEFPIGTTTVNCRADTSGGVVGTCSFNVTVQPDPSTPNPNGTGLLGVYYDNKDFTSPRVARIEAVNFNWGAGPPAPGVDADTFSVRWTGKVVPRHSGVYRIFTVSDDGIRLWIDGRQIINQWDDHGPTEHHGNVFLNQGVSHDVVLEMYENGGGATAKLLWESECQPKEPIPASNLLPARLECPTPDRPTLAANFVNGLPAGAALFGQAVLDEGWLKLTRTGTAFGIVYIGNFSGTWPVYGCEAKFTAALFDSICCGGFPANGFSFNLVPAASVPANPGYNQAGKEGLGAGLAVNFDTWNGLGGPAPAVEVKWLGQVIARQPIQHEAAISGSREVLINLASDGRLTVSYGGIRVLDNVSTPYTPLVIGTPKWVIGARNGAANDNHWIRDLQIVVNRATIPGLFNTGVDDLNRPLMDNASDPHYVMPVAGGLPTAPLVATAAGGFPIGPWLPDDIASAWIAPTANTYAAQDSIFVYETTFNLGGLNVSGAAIDGWVAADNGLVNILINGVSTGQSTPPTALGGEPFSTWQAFAITSGIQPGANTVAFVTRNGTGRDNPTGLRVEMCGWATPPPLLHLSLAYGRRNVAVSWGSLPHKQYFLEHTDKLSRPWVRQPGVAYSPGVYQAQIVEDYFRVARDPIRFYRVVEGP